MGGQSALIAPQTSQMAVDNRDIPPSTISALLQQQPKASSILQSDGFDKIAGYVKDICSDPDGNIKNDLEENCALIYCLIQALFRALDNRKSVEMPAVFVDNALACFDVISMALRKNPTVLFQPIDDDRVGKSVLCLWVLPKLFSTIILVHNYHIQSCIVRLLGDMLQVLEGSFRLRNQYERLRLFYQLCIEDLATSIAKFRENRRSLIEFTITIPSAEARESISRTTQQLVILETDCQMQFRNVYHACKVGLCVLSALVSKHSIIHKKVDFASLAWIVDMLERFEGVQAPRDLVADIDQSDELTSLRLEVASNLARVTASSEAFATLKQKIYSILSGNINLSVGSRRLLAVDETQALMIESLTIFQHYIASNKAMRRAAQNMLPSFQAVLKDHQNEAAGFKRVVERLVKFIESKDVLPMGMGSISAATNALDADDFDGINGSSRPVKKRKRSVSRATSRTLRSQSTTNLHRRRLRRICELLGNWNPDNLAGLDEEIPGLFSDLSETQQRDILRSMISLFSAPKSARASKVANEDVKAIWSEREWESFSRILCAILNCPSIHVSKINRVLLATVIRAFLSHTPITDHLDLQNSALGKWCLLSLRSSIRQLRIAAGNCLPAFLGLCGGEAISARNRKLLLETLKQMVELGDTKLCEIVILSFGHVAKSCDGDERVMALNQLVEYLGHTSKLVCDLAHIELKELAFSLQYSRMDALFQPYWRVIGVTVVKDFITRPQKAKLLSDLLGLRMDQFLSLTQQDILPWLVLEKRHDIIQRLANLCGREGSVWDLCMHKRNLPAILALIVIEHPEDLEIAVSSYLSQTSSEFAEQDAATFLRADPISLASEVLRLGGERNGVGEEQAIKGFLELVLLIERKGQQAKSASTQARMSALFFENHALGIMNEFSSIMENKQELVFNKKRCVHAIRLMVIAGQANIVVALPQIRAILQSALETDSLRDSAFFAWSALIKALNQTDEIGGLIGHTFATIVQNWDLFSESTQQEAYEVIASLIKNHGELIQSMMTSIPSLGSIALLSKFETQLARFRNNLDVAVRLHAFDQRCRDENAAVVLQALRELSVYLEANQQWVHESAVTEQPNIVIPSLVRSLLDVISVRNEVNSETLELALFCLGIIGCLDPNRVEAIKEKSQIVVLSNFEQLTEAVDFVAVLLESVLIKAFNSVSNPRLQGFLAFVMQELLKFCGFSKEASSPFRPYGSQGDEVHQRWLQMSDQTRATLTPFLSSRYVLTALSTETPKAYPLFSPQLSHGTWLRDLVQDLLHRSNGENAKQIFGVISRVVRGNDISIAAFILPFVVANVILGGTEKEVKDVGRELLAVLQCDLQHQESSPQSDSIKASSESVFQVLDYLTRFLQDKKKALNTAQSLAARSARPMPELEEQAFISQIHTVDSVLKMIPAHVISRRAVECGSFSRALFHWEQHMRHMRKESTKPQGTAFESDQAFQRLQDIYSQIDEPDGIEGISTYLRALRPEQQILEHRRAGRWSAVQSWCELKLKEDPENLTLHVELLDCLKQAGQHQLVLDHAGILGSAQFDHNRILGIVSEAAWSCDNLKQLASILAESHSNKMADFNAGLGVALIALQNADKIAFLDVLKCLRMSIARTMSGSTTTSLQACHMQMMQLHVLYEVQALSGNTTLQQAQKQATGSIMNQRLDVLGSYIPEKRYLLSIRRATMTLFNSEYSNQDLASSWLTSAKLARKENWSNSAYYAVMQAARLGDEAVKVEQAKLLWKEGEHRKAISSLDAAIELNAFSGRSTGISSTNTSFSNVTAATSVDNKQNDQNLVLAKAHLLLAKWLDIGGQTQSSAINHRYQLAARSFTRWEKGLYSLGRFYNKLIESEKALPLSKQSFSFLGGETAKLVIENFLRSLMFGCKYVFESVPKLLTLWLDFGNDVNRSISKEVPEDVRTRSTDIRPRMLETINKQIRKYSDKLPPYLFYTALAQMVTRMGHLNQQVYELLSHIIVKVVAAHPQQGLWPLLAVVKSTGMDRAKRANGILGKLMEKGKSVRSAGQDVDLKSLVTQGQKLSTQLLHACETKLEGRATTMSLTKDIGFNSKVAPCALVVPVEQTLSASLPTSAMDHMQIKSHRAFPMSREAVTISSFQDDVLILHSLQKPRKLTVRGSDGRKYGLLCKPNDDLRKDQRLMEFNSMINRALKKDAESSKRRLYIKTYAVTPLNETCGLIEWVDGLKPMRDILLSSYRSKGTKVDYNLLRELLTEACAKPENYKIFSEQIIPMYEPVLHEWFSENFPDPESWFTARLRYTRSAAVTSMQGYTLGLGDRHGENVLLEQNSGGVFHVDFNCLFEKGLTFDKPEVVPFRLTHNMVDAFGAYGVEGPFRRSAECSMKVMRASEDALLTIMETFVYDPTTDFVGPRKRVVKGVPETPKEVLDSVRSKLRGLMKGESVPLSVGGHVDALITQATDPKNLCAMYIGWCAFL